MARLSGPFVLASVAYAAAGAVVVLLLRPDPLRTARQLARVDPNVNDSRQGSSFPAAIVADPAIADAATRRPERRWQHSKPLVLAASGMVIAQAVMIAVMTMTPVHLEDHHHGLGAIGLIIGMHIGAMYLPSPLAGQLVDKHSAASVSAAGGVLLVAAACLAAASRGEPVLLGVALILLGVGWNVALVGGTASVTNLTALDDRARVQGSVDVFMALSGAAGGLLSGLVLAVTSFRILSFAAAVLALVIVGTAATTRRPLPAISGH